MKRSTIIIGAVLALSLTACQKELRELQDAEAYNYALTATRESDPETRATLADNGALTWDAEESIGMYTSANKFEKMTTSEGGATATFKGLMEGKATTCAVYPYSIAKSLSSDKVTVELPAERNWEANKVDPPMLATFSESNPSSLTFKHLGGLVKITLKGVPAKYTSFSFIADKAIVGSFEAGVNDSEPKISSTAESSTNNTLKFTFSNTDATDMDFYIPVPVGSYNFSIKLAAESGESLEKSGKVSVERGKYHSLAALTISETSGSGESSTTSTTVPSTHEGTFYLPSTSGTVKLTMEGNTHAVKLAYAYETGAQHPANVNISCTGAVSSLTLNLPDSHVEVNGEATGSTVTISNLTSSTSAGTLVLENTVKIAEKLTVAKGSATIGCEVPNVTVEAKADGDESTDVVTIKVAEGGNITTKLEVAQGNVEIAAGTVKEIEVKESVGETATVKVASGATVTDKLTVAKAACVEVAGTVKEVAVETAVSNVTIASAVETVTISNATSSTTTETAPVIWVTETGKVTVAVEDKTATSGTSSVTVVAANGQTADSDVKDGQVKVVKNSSGSAITNAVKTPAEYLVAGGEVTLEQDLTGNFEIAADKEVTINLNGKTVSNGESSTAATFTVALGGKLTINGEGTVDNKTNRYPAIHNNGTLVLNGGTYTRSKEATGNSYYTILNHGDMTVYSGVKIENTGTFSSTVASGYDTWKADASKYTYDSKTNHQNPTLTINGGTITGGKYNVKNGTDGTLTVAAGVELAKVKDNGTLTAYVASESTLNAALGNTAFTKIILNKDIALANRVTINGGREVTIDMNNHSITKNSIPFDIRNAKVNFDGTGTIAESVDDQFGALLLGGAETDCADYTVVTIGKDITLKGWSGIFVDADESGYNNYGLKVNFNGKVTRANGFTKDACGIYINGSNKQTTGNVPEFNLDGASIDVKNIGIYAAGYAKWNIKNSTIIGNDETAIEIRAGEATISGGTYTSNASPLTVVPNGNGTTTAGAALAVSQHTTNLPIDVTVSGGTFNGVYSIWEKDVQDEKSRDQIKLSVTGGTFNGAVYSQNNASFISGGTFSDPTAMNYMASNANVNIKLNGDYTGPGVFVKADLNATAVLDLNKHTFTCNGPAVGSKGTENQVFHLEKNNTITIKNGKVVCQADKADLFKFVVQNYCNLTVEDVTLDGTNLNYSNKGYYTLSNNCGNININGATTIIAKEGERAFDVCKFSSYTEPTVTWNSTGTVEGIVELTGGKLVLGQDMTISRAIKTFDAAATIDLNGKTIKPSSDWKAYDKTTGYGSDALVVVRRTGDLTITGNGFIDVNGNQNIYAAVKLTEAGEAANGDAAKLTIENGTFKGYYYAISGNGTRHNTDLTINDGTFKAYATDGNTAIYHPQKGTFTVKGGNFEGIDAAIELRAGTLNISGGTFTATASEFSKAANGNGNGTTVVGAALAISQHVTDLDIKVNVTGGTFKGVYALYEDDLQNETGNVSVTVDKTKATLDGKVYSKHNTALNLDTDNLGN